MMDGLDEEVIETEEDHDDEEIVSKRGAASVVWKFFSFRKSNVDQTTFTANVVKLKLLLQEETLAIYSTT